MSFRGQEIAFSAPLRGVKREYFLARPRSIRRAVMQITPRTYVHGNRTTSRRLGDERKTGTQSGGGLDVGGEGRRGEEGGRVGSIKSRGNRSRLSSRS